MWPGQRSSEPRQDGEGIPTGKGESWRRWGLPCLVSTLFRRPWRVKSDSSQVSKGKLRPHRARGAPYWLMSCYLWRHATHQIFLNIKKPEELQFSTFETQPPRWFPSSSQRNLSGNIPGGTALRPAGQKCAQRRARARTHVHTHACARTEGARHANSVSLLPILSPVLKQCSLMTQIHEKGVKDSADGEICLINNYGEGVLLDLSRNWGKCQMNERPNYTHLTGTMALQPEGWTGTDSRKSSE